MTRLMKPFLSSAKTAEQVIAARKDPVWVGPQLNFTSRRRPPSEHADNFEVIQEAIGEGLIRLIAVSARHGVTMKPGLDRLLIVDRDRTFAPELRQSLVARFALMPDKPATDHALIALADDLRSWASNNPEARTDFGIDVDAPSGEVFVRCPNLAPVIPPLK